MWDETGKISESMRPPALQPVTDDGEASATMDELLEDPLRSPDRLSEATCTPTPTPIKEREHHIPGTGADPELSSVAPPSVATPQVTTDGVEAVLDIDTVESLTQNDVVESVIKVEVVEATSVTTDLIEQPESSEEVGTGGESTSSSRTAHHEAESEADPEEVEDAVDTPDTAAVDEVGKISEHSESSLDTADTERSLLGSEEATETSLDVVPTTPSTPNEPKGKKRKLDEIEDAVSDQGTTDNELNSSFDAETADTVFVSRKSNKRTYSAKNRSHVAKTPSRQSKRQQSSTPDTITPQINAHSDQPPAKRRSDRRSKSPSKTGGDSTPVVIFSSATTIDSGRTATNKAVMRTFRKLGGKVTEAILEATMLCVPKGPLKKTSKLVMAVALGLEIVTEDWLGEAHRRGEFPGPQSYLPSEKSSEQEWGISLEDAIARGKHGLTHLLSGVTVFFTKRLRSDLAKLERDFSQIATRLGAESVKRQLPSLKDSDKPAASEVLVVGVRDDPQGALVGRLGYTLFNKDILVMAALRGRLERDNEEFRMDVPVKEEEEDA